MKLKPKRFKVKSLEKQTIEELKFRYKVLKYIFDGNLIKKLK